MPDLDLIYLVILFITIIVGFARLYKFGTYVLIPWMLLCMLLNSCVQSVIKFHDGNNLFLSHLWTPIEYTFLATIYYDNIQRASVKKVIFWSIPAVIATAVFLTVYIEGPAENDSYAIIVANLLTMPMALAYLYELLRSTTIIRFRYHPLCWLSIGLLIHNYGKLITDGPLNILMKTDMKLASLVYHAGYFFTMLYFFSIIAASLFASKTKLQYD